MQKQNWCSCKSMCTTAVLNTEPNSSDSLHTIITVPSEPTGKNGKENGKKMFWREYVHVQTAKKAGAYTTLLWSGATYPLPSTGPDLSQNYSLHFGNMLKRNHATRNAKRISWCSTAKMHSNSSTEITEWMKVPSISEVTPQQSDATTLPYISIINMQYLTSDNLVVEGDESRLACWMFLGQLFQLMIDRRLQCLETCDVCHVAVLARQPLRLSGCVESSVAISMTST